MSERLFAAVLSCWLLLCPCLEAATSAKQTVQDEKSLALVLSPNAPDLEKFAANELKEYLEKLYGIQARVVASLEAADQLFVVLGSPATNPAIEAVLSSAPWPEVSDQGIVLKRLSKQGRTILVIGGGSPAATLWAVYDFVQLCGVRFLLEKDVLPEKPAPFPPPTLDLVQEPELRFRSYRGINDLATSLVFYGMEDYRHLIDQLAKLKFNVLYVQTYPSQPFVHYEFRGQRKTTGVLHYGWKLPIHAQTIGRKHFRGMSELTNPDFEGARSYQERVVTAERLLHGIFAYAKSRGMQTGLMFWINQFTSEFNRRLPEWSDREYVPIEAIKGLRTARLGVSEFGVNPSFFSYLTPGNPVMTELNRTIIRTHVRTYPEVDYYGIFQPELPKSGEEYLSIWKRLDKKYQLQPKFKLEQLIHSARTNTQPVGVRKGERPLHELKAAIAYAGVLDQLINEEKILDSTENPKATIVASTFSDEFYPVMAEIFPERVMLQVQMDYLSSLAAERTEMLSFAASTPMKVGVMATLADDNIGVLPQLPTPSLHRILKAMKRYKVHGFFGRNFLVTKLEAATAYLAQASWRSDLTPEAVYRDQVEQVCGRASVADMLEVYRLLEAVTLKSDRSAMGFLFPVPNLMRKHWLDDSGPVAAWDQLTADYRRAIPLLESALSKSRPQGKSYVEQLLGQLKSSAQYIGSVQQVRQARLAYLKAQRSREAKDPAGYEEGIVESREGLQRALSLLEAAIEDWARVVRDPSDLGALAVLNCYAFDYLKGVAWDVYLESQRWSITF